MASKIFYLHIPAEDFHGFYSALTALHSDQGNSLQVSLSTLQHHDFDAGIFARELFTIRKGIVKNSKDIVRRKMPGLK